MSHSTDSAAAAPTATSDPPSLHVSALYVYPIKAAKGIRCNSAQLTGSGLVYDRAFMVVSADTGRFVSQREEPSMALVSPSLPPEALKPLPGSPLPQGAVMTVRAPGMTTLSVPLQINQKDQETLRSVNVWEWTGNAIDMGDEAASWFSRYLGMSCRLTRYLGTPSSEPSDESATAPDAVQGQHQEVHNSLTVRTTAPEFVAGFETRFTDGYPCLLATQASLLDLSNRVGSELPMERFRPNIVIGGSRPWEEDSWARIRVTHGGTTIEFETVKPCDRCKVTTIDPDTTEDGEEPLETLGTFRSGEALGWSEKNKAWKHAVFFGWNVVSRQAGVYLSEGDEVQTVSRER